jgi:hypothetical protein
VRWTTRSVSLLDLLYGDHFLLNFVPGYFTLNAEDGFGYLLGGMQGCIASCKNNLKVRLTMTHHADSFAIVYSFRFVGEIMPR